MRKGINFIITILLILFISCTNTRSKEAVINLFNSDAQTTIFNIDTIVGKFFTERSDTFYLYKLYPDTTESNHFILYDIYKIPTLEFNNFETIDLYNEGDLDGDGLDELGCLSYSTCSGCYANYCVLTFKNGWNYLYEPIYYEWIGLTDLPFKIEDLVSPSENPGLVKIKHFDIERDTPQNLSDMIEEIIPIQIIPIDEYNFNGYSFIIKQ